MMLHYLKVQKLFVIKLIKQLKTIKKDAVVGFAVIINPPEEVCIEWDKATYDKFYNDTWACLGEIEPRIFRSENVLMDVVHKDEGIGMNDDHNHKIGVPKDENGKYCGSLIDAKLLATINQKYPELMRQRGWNMEDLDVTDWDRYKTDKKYKEERKAKNKTNGLSTSDFIKKKIADNYKKSEEVLQQMNESLQELETMKAEKIALEDEIVQLKANKKQTKDKIVKDATDEAEKQAKKIIDDASEEAKKIIASVRVQENAVNDKQDELTKWQEEKELEFQKREDALEAQQKAIDDWVEDAENLKDAVDRYCHSTSILFLDLDLTLSHLVFEENYKSKHYSW